MNRGKWSHFIFEMSFIPFEIHVKRSKKLVSVFAIVSDPSWWLNLSTYTGIIYFSTWLTIYMESFGMINKKAQIMNSSKNKRTENGAGNETKISECGILFLIYFWTSLGTCAQIQRPINRLRNTFGNFSLLFQCF